MAVCRSSRKVASEMRNTEPPALSHTASEETDRLEWVTRPDRDEGGKLTSIRSSDEPLDVHVEMGWNARFSAF
jgi:hypothetical protein